MMRTSVGLSLQDGLDLAGIDVLQLWWRYAALGGQAGPALLAHRVAASPLDEHEHNLIAQALNEYFADCGLGTFPVGYLGGDPAVVAPGNRPVRAHAVDVVEIRRRAAAARRASIDRHRHARFLQLTAARLMLASGQVQFAHSARRRADLTGVRLNRALGRDAA